MRNLKRALSLALASVMLLGMMVVGTSAKGLDDFGDAAEINNADAVAVTSEIGIFKGYDDGEFKPENVVTRAEMAVIIAKMLYGADVKVEQFAEIDSFTDVPAWAEGYVNLCASLGIVAGRGNGIFDPNATVTTAEAAMMLTKTLGYFQNAKDFGDNWALAATAKATQLGLYGDLKLSANAGLSRENVAVMVFNALTKAVPVQYNELLGVYYNENQGIIYSLEFNYLETLGYKNFDLVYKSDDVTMYGRPATTWGFGSYKTDKTPTASGNKAQLTSNGGLIPANVRMLSTDEIITIANTPDYVYTTGTDEKVMYKELGANVCDETEYTWSAYVNGKLEDASAPDKKLDTDYKYTGKGSVTEIYINDYAYLTADGEADGAVTVVEINYYLGEVSSVKEDYVNVKALSAEPKLDDRTFETTAYAEDDLVVFTVDYNSDNEYFIAEMMAPATMTGEVTRVNKDDVSEDTYIRLNGETDKYYYTAIDTHMVYDVADTTWNKHPELNTEYVLYMTPEGYVLGFEPAEEVIDQYLYVQDSDEELRDWIAKVVLTDATNPKVDLKKTLKNFKDSEIKWTTSTELANKATNIDELIWKYTVSDAGVYTLTAVRAMYPTELFEINNGLSYVDGETEDSYFLVDQETIFVDVKGGKAYTGYDEVPNISNAELAYVTDKNEIAEVIFVLDGDIYDKESTYFMLTGDSRDTLEYTVDGEEYWEYFDAYVNGEKQTMTIGYDAVEKLLGNANARLQAGVLYKAVKTIDDIYVTELEEIELDNFDVFAVGAEAFRLKNGETVNKQKFDTDEETEFVLVEYIPKDMKAYRAAVASKTAYTGGWKYVISDAEIDDMFVGKDDEGFSTYVTVVEQTKQNADLVYILYTDVAAQKVPGERTITVEGNATADLASAKIDETVAIKVTAKGGYTITEIDCEQASKINVSTGIVTVPAGEDNIVIKVATDAHEYAVTCTGNDYWDVKVVDAEGNEVAKAVQGEKYTATATAKYTAYDENGEAIVTLNGAKVGSASAGGVKEEWNEIAAEHAIAVLAMNGTVYKLDNGKYVEATLAEVKTAAETNPETIFYTVKVAGVKAVATYEFIADYTVGEGAGYNFGVTGAK